nr:DUF1835 domain-containing protein [Paenibacillus soyae]
MLHVRSLKEGEGQPEDGTAPLIRLYDGLIGLPDKIGIWEPVPDCSHVHVVIGDSFAGSMKHALEELGWSERHKLIVLRDPYAIGPLAGIDSPQGRQARYEWLRDHIAEADEAYASLEEEYEELLRSIQRIPDHAEVVVWTGGNAFEQAGMRHAVYLLGGKGNTVSLYNTTEIGEKLDSDARVRRSFRSSGELSSKTLQKALTRMSPSDCLLLPSGRARLAEEWKALSEKAAALRIWSEGMVLEVPADYYDDYLLETLDGITPPAGSDGFIRAARLIGQAFGHCEQVTNDSYLEYRVRELVYAGKLEIKGVPAAMRFYSVRRRSVQ